MCGIVGFVSRTAAVESAWAARRGCAMDSIRHRGPDAHGEYADGQVWLGHRRLSILDLSEAGRQPMATDDGRYVVSYNGEVYNFRELASELSLRGLRSHSDTEVVLRTFEQLGEAAFRRFNGMYAFALYDRPAQTLWLVRDRLGIKPLYFRIDADGLTFGSEIKALYALDGRSRVCDSSRLHEWLYYGNTLGGRTLHAGIEQLPPGHCLAFDIRTFQGATRPYWSLPRDTMPTGPTQPASVLVLETRRLLEHAVRRQLVSDVPVGVFLSGGVDSSAIVAFASRHYSGRLATYSAGFDDRRGVDERPKARRVAQLFGTDHHEIQIHGGEVADLVEKLVHHHDMPFADAANIPLYQMAAPISGTTKVVLQGDGGDELFGGYRRYVTLRYRRLLRPLAVAGQPLARLAPGSPLRSRVQRYLRALAAPDLGMAMARLLTTEDPDTCPTAMFAPRMRDTVERTDPFARYLECQDLVADRDVGSQMSLVDLMVVLPDLYLEKVDRATMATSLEVRVPFLDHDLVSAVAAIPGTARMPWGRKKWLLKQALAGIVPHDVLYGPKTGLTVPFGYWLRTSLKPLFFDHLATFERRSPDVLDCARIRSWHAETQERRQNHTHLLWKALNLMIWCNTQQVEVPV